MRRDTKAVLSKALGHGARARTTASVVAVLAGVAACVQGQESAFTNEAFERGIIYNVNTGVGQLGSGLGLFDMDGDGDPDAILTGSSDGRIGLFENDGTGHFLDRTFDFDFIPAMQPSTQLGGVSAVDFDADGDLDIHLVVTAGADRFYRNNGDWTFTNIATLMGVADPGYGMSAAWADIDGDTKLDMYLSVRTNTFNLPGENALFQKQPNPFYIDVCPVLEVQATGEPTLLSAFFDFDLDGDTDLYLGTDKGNAPNLSNHLFENTGGAFLDITDASNTAANVHCMGIAYGDVDGNGWPDIYVTNIPLGNKLLLNNGDKTFTEAQDAAGVTVNEVGWGTVFFDYNHDGLLDLYVCNQNAPNRLFRNEGSFPMTDVSGPMAVAGDRSSYCVSTADVDGDGDLDMLVTEIGRTARLFINNEGQKRNWAKFDVVGTGENIFGIGATLEVDAPGLLTQHREVRAGHHYKAQDPTTVHFGLNTAPVMDEIRVRWPYGAGERTLNGYKTNLRWTIYPPQRLGDFDLDGVVTQADYDAAAALLAAEGRPLAARPGNEQLDVDGDADIDADDLALISAGFACNAADIAAPFGELNVNDVIDFVNAFNTQSPAADIFPDGLFNANDVIDFVNAFNAGCP